MFLFARGTSHTSPQHFPPDILYAKMRQDYALKHGVEHQKIDGVDTVVTLN